MRVQDDTVNDARGSTGQIQDGGDGQAAQPGATYIEN